MYLQAQVLVKTWSTRGRHTRKGNFFSLASHAFPLPPLNLKTGHNATFSRRLGVCRAADTRKQNNTLHDDLARSTCTW